MIRSRFLWKLYAGYALLILLTAGLIGSLVAARIESETIADTDRRLRAEAMLLRDVALSGLDDPAGRQLQVRVADLGAEIQTRLTIILADGVVLADSQENPEVMDNHGNRPEVGKARAEGIGTASRFSRTLRQRMRYLAVPIYRDGSLVGFARSSLPLTVLTDRLSQLRTAVLLAAAIATLVALLLGFLHARRVTRPLLEMAVAAESIAAGNYEESVHTSSDDELGTLALAFNAMSRQLHRSLAMVEADRNKLTAILASMDEGVVAVDRDERVVHINRVAGSLLGIVPEDSIGRHLWEVSRIPELSEVLAETLRGEQPVHRSIRLAGHNDRILDLHASPLDAGGGVLAGAVMVLDDVTQLRRLETMRRDFFGNVSHELKTPVAAIHGLVETLIEDPDAKPEIRIRFLTKIRNQSNRLSNLVTDLLSISRLESGGGIADLEPIDLHDVVGATTRTLAPTSEARQVTLATALPEEPCCVMGDEEALRQAISNLVENAIKFSPEQGTVQIRVTTPPGKVLVEVEDHGIGIEPRHLERIFERFYRVDKARSRELGGTGLGLAIVKHTVLAMNGQVTVDSAPGRGTVFRISLPSYEDREEPEGGLPV